MCPPLVKYDNPSKYKIHFEETYCKTPTLTFDGIKVFFSKNNFEHAFYESSDRRGSKDIFSIIRAQRIDWIKKTLENASASIYQGWDKKKKVYMPHRRVSVVYEDFVVIISLSLNKTGDLKGKFITCYQADNSIGKIRNSPIWDKKSCINYLEGK